MMSRNIFIAVVLLLSTGHAVLAASHDDWQNCTAEHWKTAQQWDAARAACSRIIADPREAAPRRAEAYYRRVLALKARNDDWGHPTGTDEVIPDLDQAIALKPDLGEPYNLRGWAYANKDCRRAIADWDAAIKRDPALSQAYSGRGQCYLTLGEHQRAIKDLDAAIQLKENATTYVARAVAYLALGDRARALRDYAYAEKMPAQPYHPILETDIRNDANRNLEALLAALNSQDPNAAGSLVPTRRVALLIGNSRYMPPNALTNPRNDVTALAKVFNDLGFEVTALFDLDRTSLFSEIRKFEHSLRANPPDWAVVYFSGHGAETANGAYMLPIDALFQKEGEFLSDITIEEDSAALQNVLKRMQAARQLRLIIFDACRVNPVVSRFNRMLENARNASFVTSRATGMGWGKDAILFSAQPRRYAFDGAADGNSPFVTALIEALKEPNVEFIDLFKSIRQRVAELTKTLAPEPQIPDLQEGYDTKHYFNTGKVVQSATAK